MPNSQAPTKTQIIVRRFHTSAYLPFFNLSTKLCPSFSPGLSPLMPNGPPNLTYPTKKHTLSPQPGMAPLTSLSLWMLGSTPIQAVPKVYGSS